MIRKENLEATLKAIGYIQSTRTNVFEKSMLSLIALLKLILMATVPLIIQKKKE